MRRPYHILAGSALRFPTGGLVGDPGAISTSCDDAGAAIALGSLFSGLVTSRFCRLALLPLSRAVQAVPFLLNLLQLSQLADRGFAPEADRFTELPRQLAAAGGYRHVARQDKLCKEVARRAERVVPVCLACTHNLRVTPTGCRDMQGSPDDVCNADRKTVGKALRPPPALTSGARSKCANTPSTRRGCALEGAAKG